MASSGPPFTEEDVNNLKLKAALRLCDECSIPSDDLETLEEMKEALLDYLQNMTQSEEDGDESTNEETEIQDMINDIFSKDATVRKALHAVYDTVKKVVTDPTFDSEMRTELKKRYGDYVKLLEEHKKKLEDEDCHIVVTGAVSSGKSSFINLLAGIDVLPTSTLRCTSALIQIRNAGKQSSRIVLHGNGKSTEEKNVTNVEELREKLIPYTTFDSTSDDPEFDLIEVYSDIPMLHEHVSIVDTPGVGDTEELTAMVLKFLKKAIAFIFLIDSSDAGGLHQSKLLQVLEEQKKWTEQEETLHTFDPRLTVFVCNKWDAVEDHEKDKVWNFIKKKLHNTWPGLVDKQITKLSVKKELKRNKQKRKSSREFQEIMNYIKRMVPASLEMNVKRHADWLEGFVGIIVHSTTTKINASRKTKEEKERFIRETERKLSKLSETSKKERTLIVKDINLSLDRSAQHLHDHIHSYAVRRKLNTWLLQDCPSFVSGSNADNEISRRAKELISERIKGEIKIWMNENSHLLEAPSRLVEFQSFLQTEISSIHESMQAVVVAGYTSFYFSSLSVSAISLSIAFFTVAEIGIAFESALAILIGGTFGIGFLAIGAVAAAVAVASWFGLTESPEDKYRRTIIDAMSNWTDKALESLTKKELTKCLDKSVFSKYRSVVITLCEDEIPRYMDTDRHILESVKKEHRSAEQIFQCLAPLQQKAQECLHEINILKLRYYSQTHIPTEAVEKLKEIGKGTFGNTFIATLTYKGKQRKVVLKELCLQIGEKTSELFLSNVTKQTSLEHTNIAKMYGHSYLEEGPVCQIVREYCDTTLDQNLPTIFSCSTPSKTQVFVQLTVQICCGLQYLHEQCEFVHFGIKLENILVEGNVLKIADPGFGPELDTPYGAAIYMAPELWTMELSKKPYPVDIYSIGILFWEVWNTKRAYSLLHKIKDPKRFVLDGNRPSTDDMESDLKSLIEKCWHRYADARPKIKVVLEELNSL